jgi:hypothetical protein
MTISLERSRGLRLLARATLSLGPNVVYVSSAPFIFVASPGSHRRSSDLGWSIGSIAYEMPRQLVGLFDQLLSPLASRLQGASTREKGSKRHCS